MSISSSRSTTPSTPISPSNDDDVELMKKLLGLKLLAVTKEDEISKQLSSGVLLCNFVNKLKPRTIPVVMASLSPSQPVPLPEAKKMLKIMLMQPRNLVSQRSFGEKFDLLRQELLSIKEQLGQLSKVGNSGGDGNGSVGGSTLSRVANNSFDETVEESCITRSGHCSARVYIPENERFRNLTRIGSLTCVVISCEVNDKWYLISRKGFDSRCDERFRLDDPMVTIELVTVGDRKMIYVKDDTRKYCAHLRYADTIDFFKKVNDVKKSLTQ
uniref:Calponin-homology (CH) domain-containing protein n=1 Tax=Strongyloides papillosus TaxID=174720 RepID=A0A0N5BY06_STREA